MELKKVNEILSDLTNYGLRKKFSQVLNETNSEDYGNTIRTEVYKIDDEDNYLKVTRESDSYDENETLNSVQFVKPVITKVTDFKPV